jgi:hypothetical protein
MQPELPQFVQSRVEELFAQLSSVSLLIHVQWRTAARIRPYASFTSKLERYGPPSLPLHPKIQGTSHPFNHIQVPHLRHFPRFPPATIINMGEVVELGLGQFSH